MDIQPPRSRPPIKKKPAATAVRPSAVQPARKKPAIRRLVLATKHRVPNYRFSPKHVRLIKIGVVLAIIFVIYSLYTRADSQKTDAVKTTPTLKTVSGELTKGTPEYKTILPNNKTIESLGGWTRVSPPDRNPVFAYADKIDGTPINVSEQPLPNDFKEDTSEQVQLLAQGYLANKKITVDNTEVFLGTSAKGPQSVIFTKNGLLILIKANVAISDDAWTAYIKSMK